MTDFAAALADRLDRLASRHGSATFWLRDDDARVPSPALDRLLGLAADGGAPLALAVIPQGATPALADRLADAPEVFVLQHGFSHANHAPSGEKKCELGDHRSPAVVHAEIAAGRARLDGFPRSLPVLVPPWNRIGPGVAAGLPTLGFQGMSMFGMRSRGPDIPDLRLFNCHIDLVDWHGGRRFHGPARVLDLLARHLDRQLAGDGDPAEPTGILSHHLVHDEDAFGFLSSLVRYLGRRNDCRFLSALDLLA